MVSSMINHPLRPLSFPPHLPPHPFPPPCLIHSLSPLLCASPSSYLPSQQFFHFFQTLVGKPVVVELKNDLSLRGTLHSVDQYLNVKLDHLQVVDAEKHPHLIAVSSCFIRGSVVRYIQLPAAEVDTQLLQDTARRAARAQQGGG